MGRRGGGGLLGKGPVLQMYGGPIVHNIALGSKSFGSAGNSFWLRDKQCPFHRMGVPSLKTVLPQTALVPGVLR